MSVPTQVESEFREALAGHIEQWLFEIRPEYASLKKASKKKPATKQVPFPFDDYGTDAKLQAELEEIASTVVGTSEWLDEALSRFADEQDVDKVLDAYETGDLKAAAEQIRDILKIRAAEAAVNALQKLDITEQPLFDLVNTDALVYARERAAELVGMKNVNGEWVENPNQKWAITETTRNGLRDLVTKAYTDGLTPAQLRKEIQGAYNFSKDRSKMIAITEMNRSSTQGTLAALRRSGVVEGKSILLSNDHDVDDLCDSAAEMGVIALDEDFEGEDGPPLHPQCLCSLVAHVSMEEDESEEG